MNKVCVTIAMFVCTCLCSCKTYYIPVESFKQQFAGMDSSNMREVATVGPMGVVKKYDAHPIDSIYAVDKKGNPVVLVNSPAMEMRITDSSNKKTIFYFDLTRFDGENIVGSKSRIIPSMRKTIPISSVKKIEVQNGGKNYHYVQQ